MIIILSLLALLVISFVLYCVIDDNDYEVVWPAVLVGLSGFLLVCALILLPISRAGSRDLVREYHSIKQTIETQRVGAEAIERAALTTKILEVNAGLANTQYYARSLYTNWFYDTSTGLLDLKPLQ